MTPPLFGLAAIALALGAAPAAAQQKLKIGFIYVGPVGDFGWSYQHDQGRKAIEKALGDKVETTYVESVPEADSGRAIEGLARTGHGLVFTTSFGFMEPTLKVARRYPNVKFEHGTGINSYFLGAQSVNPNVKIKVVWVNSWYDPAKEADAAKALLDQGVDVLAQHTDSPAPLQTAEARGKLGFGQASDMERFAPKAQLTAIVDDWSHYYVARAKAALEGTWKSEDTWHGLKDEMVVMAPYKNMPDDVKKIAEETEAAIKSGQLNPFKCPIAKQDGSAVECKGGAALADEQILSMNFYVKGIDDKLPQ